MSLSRAGDKRVAQPKPHGTRDASEGSTFSFWVLCLKIHGTSMVGDVMICLTSVFLLSCRISIDTERQQRTEAVITFWAQKKKKKKKSR